jgi:hypothetical protein
MPYSTHATHPPVGAQPRGVAQGSARGIASSSRSGPETCHGQAGSECVAPKGDERLQSQCGHPEVSGYWVLTSGKQPRVPGSLVRSAVCPRETDAAAKLGLFDQPHADEEPLEG